MDAGARWSRGSGGGVTWRMGTRRRARCTGRSAWAWNDEKLAAVDPPASVDVSSTKRLSDVASTTPFVAAASSAAT